MSRPISTDCTIRPLLALGPIRIVSSTLRVPFKNEYFATAQSVTHQCKKSGLRLNHAADKQPETPVIPDKLCDKEFTLSGAGGSMAPPMNRQLLLVLQDFICPCPQLCHTITHCSMLKVSRLFKI